MKLERWALRAACLAGALALLGTIPAAAQDESQATEGVNSGNYNIQQSLEAGYRYTNFTGSRDVYNTYVNLNPGFRLFDHTLHMRSLNHNGLLFDDFFIASFGYGGDPNDVTRLRFYKNKWYNFSGSFRRDRNFWDYNLLANPINPVNAAPFPTLQLGFSPHSFQTTRRMSDFSLVVLPQSRIRFRTGYNHSVSEGPTLSSVHQGTDALLLQDWRTTIDSYRFGADFKLLPRTNFSYDQFLEFFKGDTTWQDNAVLLFPLGGGGSFPAGTPVDLGIIFNRISATSGQPCATPLIANPSPPPAFVANPACNFYAGYSRAGRPRNFFPTEQFSFQSSYFNNIDMSGRVIYSSSDIFSSDFSELFAGLITRTNQIAFLNAGPAETKRVSVTADWAATLRVTDKFRVVDTFRFNSFRLPGQWLFLGASAFPVAAGVLQHNSNSPADFSTGRSERFLGQNVKYNTFELEYDFTKRLAGRIGYRYGNRHIVDRATQIIDTEIFLPNTAARGDCSNAANCTAGTVPGSLVFTNANQPIANLTVVEGTTINEHSLLLGLKARPLDTLRISYDMEVFFADDAFTRISPRNLQHYEVRASYKPRSWMTFATSVNIIENRDNVVNVNNLQHNRSYGLNAAFAPNDRFAIDLGWDYNDIFSQINICYVSSTAPKGSTACPGVATPTTLVQALSFYTNTTHYGYGDIMWKPIKRVTTHLGYAGSAVNGNTLILSPNAPIGPLQFNFHRPYGGFAVDLLKGLTWKADWRYYGYNEKAEPSFTTVPTGRDFRGNMVTIVFRYAF